MFQTQSRGKRHAGIFAATPVAIMAAATLVIGACETKTDSIAYPAGLSDAAFQALIDEMSEPEGTFASTNLVSNEWLFQHVIPVLEKTTTPGNVYLGVGPEQNFT